MDRTERLYEIDRLLKEFKVVPMSRFLEELEVSRSTVKRDFEYLRDRLNAPLVWDHRRRGYRYEKPQAGMPQYALPGLWFNESELCALLSMDALLTGLQPGLLEAHLAPLRNGFAACSAVAATPPRKLAKGSRSPTWRLDRCRATISRPS